MQHLAQIRKIETIVFWTINISPLRGWLFALSIGSVSKTSANVFFGEFRIVAEDFFVRHSRSQPAEHIRHSNPHPANRWPPAALFGFHGDDVLVVHSDTYFNHMLA